ncbi:MAG: methyl-accepting chemotaxis protein [Deferrisomatales bacterium]|nr:methyl-accepting chemotaxis protein [Deferrisomatales bacterium]
MTISARMSLFLAVIFLGVAGGSGLSVYRTLDLLHDTRVINQTGVLQGATQRLVKLELQGQPQGELRGTLDALLTGLLEGSTALDLPAARDPEFREKLEAVGVAWTELKRGVEQARGDPSLRPGVLAASEAYFRKTNAAVVAAEALARSKVTQSTLIITGGTLLVLIILAAVWYTLNSRVARPIATISRRLAEVAQGDLTVNVPGGGQDEIGELVRAANSTIESVRQMVTEASTASLEMASVAEEMSASTIHIAKSNDHVSARVGDVATAAEQMNATVADTARNTAEVDRAAVRARTVATEGATVIAQTVQAVQEIAQVVEQAAVTVRSLGDESEKIGVVIQVIEDIADQTNLLALNAAIEAARAGEHGRGFAVVADEVRKLAEKTVTATKEISKTIAAIQGESGRVAAAIDDGMQSVSRGRELGARAGVAIRDIETEVGRATEQTRQIATATEQLAATTRDVSSNLEEIAQAVQANSSATSELAHTAESVALRAEELKALTRRFRID